MFQDIIITSNNFNCTFNILNQYDNFGCIIEISDAQMRGDSDQPNYTITCNYKVEGSY